MRQQENLTIRPVEERDLAFLQLAQTQGMRGHFQEAQMESMARLRSQWEKDGMLGSQFQMLMVELEGQPVGFVTAFFVREGMVRVGASSWMRTAGDSGWAAGRLRCCGTICLKISRWCGWRRTPMWTTSPHRRCWNGADFGRRGCCASTAFIMEATTTAICTAISGKKREQPAQFLACGPLPFLLRWKIKTKC